MKNKKRTRPEPTPALAVAAIPFGLAVAAAFAILLLVVSAFVCLGVRDQAPFMRPIGYAALYLSAAAGGFAAFKRVGGYFALCGLFVGAALLFLTTLLAVVLPGTAGEGWILVAARVPVIPFSIAGAYISSLKPKKRRRR